MMAGETWEPGESEEYYWRLLTGFDPSVLPRWPIEEYLKNYSPFDFMFRVGMSGDEFGRLIEFGKGDPALPNFYVSAGDLVYDSASIPAGYSNLRIESDGVLYADVA
jgi:hypothetical protein